MRISFKKGTRIIYRFLAWGSSACYPTVAAKIIANIRTQIILFLGRAISLVHCLESRRGGAFPSSW